LDRATKKVSEYVRQKGFNLSEISRKTKLPYMVLYDSLMNEKRDRDLRVDEFLKLCSHLDVDPISSTESSRKVSEYLDMPTVLGYIVWILKTQKKDRDANSKGTMLLLRVQLIEYHEKWTERGYITKHGLENFLEMYKAYHELGGNGMVTKLLEEIKKLPIKD
jgi:Cdc6-like AAA superfamily ATPase